MIPGRCRRCPLEQIKGQSCGHEGAVGLAAGGAAEGGAKGVGESEGDVGGAEHALVLGGGSAATVACSYCDRGGGLGRDAAGLHWEVRNPGSCGRLGARLRWAKIRLAHRNQGASSALGRRYPGGRAGKTGTRSRDCGRPNPQIQMRKWQQMRPSHFLGSALSRRPATDC